MFRITKQFTFEAAHQLHGLPEGHKCGNLHGHSYKVELVLESERLNEHGFVVDYGELKQFGEMIDRELDHKNLNDVMEQPTAENIAMMLYEWAVQLWPQTAVVRVKETGRTSAAYRP